MQLPSSASVMLPHCTLRRLTTIAAFALAQALVSTQGAVAAPDPSPMRISDVVGNVGIQAGDSSQPVGASLSAPMLADDVLSTGKGSRAEVRMDRGGRLRLDAQTLVRAVRDGSDATEVDLSVGKVELRVFRPGSTAQIDTPYGSLVANEPGSYVVAVHADGTAVVTTYEGSATISGPSVSESLPAGSSAVLSGTPQTTSILRESAGAPERDFASFNSSRDAAGLADLNSQVRHAADDSLTGSVFGPLPAIVRGSAIVPSPDTTSSSFEPVSPTVQSSLRPSSVANPRSSGVQQPTTVIEPGVTHAYIEPSVDKSTIGEAVASATVEAAQTTTAEAFVSLPAAHPMTGNAPADEYFGEFHISILGVRNTINNVDAHADSANESFAQILCHRLIVAEGALRDWQAKYPDDTWLPEYGFAMVRDYDKLDAALPYDEPHIASIHVIDLWNWLDAIYPNSRFAPK